MLEQTIASHGRDEDVMEEVMRMSKNAMQAMGLSFRDFLGPFATMCVNAFIAHPLSCVLYSVTTLVSIFGRESQFVQPMVDMCGALGNKTFEILSKDNAFTQRPDIVTEFYELVGRGLRRFPRNMLSAPFADTAFQVECLHRSPPCARIALHEGNSTTRAIRIVRAIARIAHALPEVRRGYSLEAGNSPAALP